MAMLPMLCGAIEERDPFLRGHSARVTALAEAMARSLGWSDRLLESLRVGGTLHDVGKLGVSQEVLRKAGPLTADDLAEIRRHPRLGAKILLRASALRDALPYVLYHHERWDGAGYPSGRAGEEIPVEARLLAIADAFDAMTSDRPYRRALSQAHALAEIERCAGAQFDPELARVFLELFESELAAAPASRFQRLTAVLPVALSARGRTPRPRPAS